MKSYQLSAARGMLRWSLRELSERTSITADAINRFERGEIASPRESTIHALKTCFEEHGVEFIHDGVRFRSDVVQTIEGDDAFLKLLDDMYYTMRETGGEILYSCVDESLSPKDVLASEKRIRDAGITFRSLVCEGDTHLAYPLDEYRYIPKAHFTTNLMAMYGDKFAILFESTAGWQAVIFKHANVTRAITGLFNAFWEKAQRPTHSDAAGPT